MYNISRSISRSSPPRPSPAGVRYSDDEESKYPDDNSSTLSDKPDNDSYDEDQESQVMDSSNARSGGGIHGWNLICNLRCNDN